MIPNHILEQAREESETGNEQYSRGFIAEVITELLMVRKALDTAHKVFAAECALLERIGHE